MNFLWMTQNVGPTKNKMHPGQTILLLIIIKQWFGHEWPELAYRYININIIIIIVLIIINYDRPKPC